MKKFRKTASGVMSAAVLMANVAQAEAVTQTETAVEIEQEADGYTALANVEGKFAFDQNVISPADDMFNIFGTAVTGLCAKPNFAFSEIVKRQYVNVGGSIAHAYTVDMSTLKTEQRINLCACATGAATANVAVTGVLLEDVLSLADIADDVNVLTVRSADGYTQKMPLAYALEKEAMLVYKINGESLPTGNQFWVPSTVAKYFTRDVVDIELTAEDEVPEVEQRADELRAEVTIKNEVVGAIAVGDEITFEGYADDCGSAIAAVEFSFDGGKTWTVCETPGTTTDKWVYWNFSVVAEKAGDYQLTVRARTQDGMVSPLLAKLDYTVADSAK